MQRVVLAVTAAIAAAVFAFFIATNKAGERAYDAQLRGLVLPEPWYFDPVNVALLVGGIVLVVGFMLVSQVGK